MRAAGVFIGDDSVTCIELSASRFGTKIKTFCREPLYSGSVHNGHIVKPDDVTLALGRVKEKYSFEFIRAAIPEDLSFVVPMRVPAGNYEETSQYITEHVEEYVPLDVNEIVSDYFFSNSHLIDNVSKHNDVVVSAVSKKIATEYSEIFLGVGMTPLSFEVDVQAIARAVVPRDEQGTVMCVDVRKGRTALFIVSGGVARFSTSVPYGEEFFEQRLSEYADLSAKAVHEVKKTQDISMSFYKDAARKALRELAVELGKHTEELLLYWKTHQLSDSILPPEHIFISGQFIAWSGVFEHIAEKMPLPSFRADPWTNVFFQSGNVPQVSARDKLNYTTAIGLALASIDDDTITL